MRMSIEARLAPLMYATAICGIENSAQIQHSSTLAFTLEYCQSLIEEMSALLVQLEYANPSLNWCELELDWVDPSSVAIVKSSLRAKLSKNGITVSITATQSGWQWGWCRYRTTHLGGLSFRWNDEGSGSITDMWFDPNNPPGLLNERIQRMSRYIGC